MNEEEIDPVDEVVNKVVLAIQRLKAKIASGDTSSIIIREEDVRPIDEDDIWAGQMFLAREEMDEDNELT